MLSRIIKYKPYYNSSSNKDNKTVMSIKYFDIYNNMDEQNIYILKKNEYDDIVKRKRKEFMFKHFHKELNELFIELHKKAEKGEICEYTVSFEIEDHFDLNKMQYKIVEYFKDLGYNPESNINLAPIREVSLVLK